MLQNGPYRLQNKRKIPYPRLWLVETVAILKVNEVLTKNKTILFFTYISTISVPIRNRLIAAITTVIFTFRKIVSGITISIIFPNISTDNRFGCSRGRGGGSGSSFSFADTCLKNIQLCSYSNIWFDLTNLTLAPLQ